MAHMWLAGLLLTVLKIFQRVAVFKEGISCCGLFKRFVGTWVALWLL